MIQQTIEIDYDGLPVNHPTATIAFVSNVLAEQNKDSFNINFQLSDADLKLIRLNKTDLKSRRLWLHTGLEILFRTPALSLILKSPEEYAQVVRGLCVFPRRERFKPDKVHTFCLIREHLPEFEVKFDLTTNELEGIKAETGGKIFIGYHYGITTIFHSTVVEIVIPAVLARLAVEVVSGHRINELTLGQLFDLSQYHIVVG